jgi:hypothetical protein
MFLILINQSNILNNFLWKTSTNKLLTKMSKVSISHRTTKLSRWLLTIYINSPCSRQSTFLNTYNHIKTMTTHSFMINHSESLIFIFYKSRQHIVIFTFVQLFFLLLFIIIKENSSFIKVMFQNSNSI